MQQFNPQQGQFNPQQQQQMGGQLNNNQVR